MSTPLYALLLPAFLCCCLSTSVNAVAPKDDKAVPVGPSTPGEPSVCLDSMDDGSCPTTEQQAQQQQQALLPVCSMYMAPSSLPSTTSTNQIGWGLYTGVSLTKGDTLNNYKDVLVPVQDHYKALPFRGQQKFLSWLQYIWPKYPEAFRHQSNAAFPVLPVSKFPPDGLSGIGVEDGLSFHDATTDAPLSMFVPGIGSLTNSHETLENIRQARDSTKSQFEITRDIPAGSELYLNYGKVYHNRLEMRETSRATYETLDDYNAKLNFTTLPTELTKRNMVNPDTMRRKQTWDDRVVAGGKITLPMTMLEPAPLGARQRSDYVDREVVANQERRVLRVLKEQQETAKNDNKDKNRNATQSIEWLQQNGVCVDNLKPGPSTTEDELTGAFATRPLTAGQLVAPTPLLLLKRDDLNIYRMDHTATNIRDQMDLEDRVGRELLLSFCYGHDRSDLLILPYGPMVHWIQHASSTTTTSSTPKTKKKKEQEPPKLNQPNVKLVWSQDTIDRGYLKLHPLELVNLSGKLRMDFIALRDIDEGEEILIGAGQDWWDADEPLERAVPDEFFPDRWLDDSDNNINNNDDDADSDDDEPTPMKYEIKDAGVPLKPGELRPLQWKHNGKQVAKYAYRLGLPKGFSESIYNYSQTLGVIDLYTDLLHDNNDTLSSDEWMVVETPDDGQWFAHRYMSSSWNFNMHYVAAWSERARISLLSAMGDAGFNDALQTMGTHFGLNNLTCFHMSFMGVTEADTSMTHTDVYATGELGFNIIFPVVVVPGARPELDVQSDDNNVVVSVKYEYDTAIVMGDWGYHKTSPVEYREPGQMRVVVGGYCASIGESNHNMISHLYDGEDPAPFMGHYLNETHWSKDGGYTLPVKSSSSSSS